MKNNYAAYRRRPVGAEVQASGGIHFRLWALRRRRVEIIFETSGAACRAEVHELEAENSGYFSGLVLDAVPGMLYRYRLDGEKAFPDPASRFQPREPHGPS